MALGSPFSPNTAGGITLSTSSTSANTSFTGPVGSNVWIVNASNTVAFVLLSAANSSPVANQSNAAAIPPNSGIMLSAPWSSGSNTGYIAAVILGGSGNLYANAGYGTTIS
jgi:hypothetical protein